jgi:hypothetical protein
MQHWLKLLEMYSVVSENKSIMIWFSWALLLCTDVYIFLVSEAGINVVIPAKAADPVDPKKLKVNAPPRF